MKKILVLLLITTFSFAQNAKRKYISHTLKKNTLEIKTNDGSYLIKPYSDKIVETSFIPNGETFNPISEGVVLNPKNANFKFTEGQNALMLSSDNIVVLINKKTFQISYSNKGEIFFSEKNILYYG